MSIPRSWIRVATVIPTLALVTHTTLVQAGTWTEQIAPPNLGFWAVHAVTSQIAWAAAVDALMIRTLDGGTTWESRPVPGAGGFRGLWGFDGDRCVVADTDCRFFLTTNGGASWAQVHDAGTFINGIQFFDDQNGWATGDPIGGVFVVVETTDAGETWTPVANPPVQAGAFGVSTSVEGVSDQIGAFGTTQANIWRTGDAGMSWSSAAMATITSSVWGLAISDLGIGYATGGSEMDRTIDFGETWQAWTPIAASAAVYPLFWINGTNEVWASTHGRWVYQSTNGGLDWVEYELDPSFYMAHDISFAGTTTGWSVSGDGPGRIFRYTSTTTGVDDAHPAPSALRVRAYPNPFRTGAQFGVDLSEAGIIEIIIYDVTGRRVTSLTEAWRGTGRRIVRWDGRDASGRPVASGAYLYRVTSPNGEFRGRIARVR